MHPTSVESLQAPSVFVKKVILKISKKIIFPYEKLYRTMNMVIIKKAYIHTYIHIQRVLGVCNRYVRTYGNMNVSACIFLTFSLKPTKKAKQK